MPEVTSMREMWYSHTRTALRKMGKLRPGDSSVIGNRVALYERIAAAEVDGKISISVDQMDCDCVRWTSGRVIDAHPRRAVEQYIESEIYGAAEGPIYWMSIDKPENRADYESRDLAMEAFEDGHPHVVYS